MLQTTAAPAGCLDPVQAVELSLLVDLEACWDNLRKTAPAPADADATTRDLSAKQKTRPSRGRHRRRQRATPA